MITTQKPRSTFNAVAGGAVVGLLILLAFVSMKGTAMRMAAASPYDQPETSSAPLPASTVTSAGTTTGGAAAQVSLPSNLQFRPEGSTLLDTSAWSRGVNMVAYGGTKAQRNNAYNQNFESYCFAADGTFWDEGRYLDVKTSGQGFYRVDGNVVKLFFTEHSTGDSPDSWTQYQETRLYPLGNGFTAFDLGNTTFCKGMSWNQQHACYQNDRGELFGQTD
ncbi:MAG TPA: hypothetical protein VLE93_00385 [Candidatus Saccharimonadales bacterium]|nr:hypothetical protein [Candidatus Saccharimonadales bacterium]